VNAKRIYRLYREMGLQLRNKTPKRRVKAKLREDRDEATQVNEWSWSWSSPGFVDSYGLTDSSRPLALLS